MLTPPVSVKTIDSNAFRQVVERHLRYTVGRMPAAASLTDWRLALSYAVRDMVIDPWFETASKIHDGDRKQVYYLSMEFLIGRLLEDAIANLGLEEIAHNALRDLAVDYHAVLRDEPDAALGNGGLGRLAACFLDSMSTVGIPALGYGIRYEHGLFRQGFKTGWQTEEAEDWLGQEHPWEFARGELCLPIGFGGGCRVKSGRTIWTPDEVILAEGYDTPIPGWRGRWVNTLRLWAANSAREFDLEPFNRGDYLMAAAPAVLAQTISRVLYPDDSTPTGKELRLKQEYFFTAASLRDILDRFLARNSDPRQLPEKVAIQLNDTHPAIAVPEFLRLLTDEHGLTFDAAINITRGCLHYTNHTLMPEALEQWPAELMTRVLPRHMQLIERIDAAEAKATKPGAKPPRVVSGGNVHMGTLAFVGSRRVNGVSDLHTRLMKRTVFRDLNALYPDRIVNQTNGITPRRWLYSCNHPLRDLLNDTIGDDWPRDLDALSALAPMADDTGFRQRFAEAKRVNKGRLVYELKHQGIIVNPDAMFDIQIKRIHEYKRQLMNILETAALWNAMRKSPDADWAPRVKIFGGKAAPAYTMAKLIIKLINDIAARINGDPITRDKLRVLYLPNYNVSLAEKLIPAADLSEQISTAGMEASGTGNMKFALNGALTVGTLDGANIEIKDAVGDDNIYIFGLTAQEVADARAERYDPLAAIAADPRLAEVIEQIENGVFSPDDPARYTALLTDLRGRDWFMVAADFSAYYDIQRKIDQAWHNQDDWTRRAILNTANMGWFSSDRTIRGYAREVWDVAPEY